jgi:hypothetical protein
MIGVAVQDATFWAFAMLLGSFGVFFVYLSFFEPDVGADAIILLGAASALAWARVPEEERSSKSRTHPRR